MSQSNLSLAPMKTLFVVKTLHNIITQPFESRALRDFSQGLKKQAASNLNAF